MRYELMMHAFRVCSESPDVFGRRGLKATIKERNLQVFFSYYFRLYWQLFCQGDDESGSFPVYVSGFLNTLVGFDQVK